jgi:hypothetical protein
MNTLVQVTVKLLLLSAVSMMMTLDMTALYAAQIWSVSMKRHQYALKA